MNYFLNKHQIDRFEDIKSTFSVFTLWNHHPKINLPSLQYRIHICDKDEKDKQWPTKHWNRKLKIYQHESQITTPHPTTGYLDNRCYRELRSYLRHTEWQVGIPLTFFFHFIYFLDFKFISDLLHYTWEIYIPNMTV